MMQIAIDVPNWLASDYAARTGQELDKTVAETAVRAYYGRLFDPLYSPEILAKNLDATHGDNDHSGSSSPAPSDEQLDDSWNEFSKFLTKPMSSSS